MATALASPSASTDRYRVNVQQHISFRRDGFLVVPQLVSQSDVRELRKHTEDLMNGRLPEQRKGKSGHNSKKNSGITMQKLESPPAHFSPEEKAQFFLRIHMLHCKLEIHERFLLHPRLLDVLEALIGPDVLAIQTMLFFKPPGKPGQGWHQDSYYIPTHPDTLCGAWIALDDSDEVNGAMWMAAGSGVEPIYPPKEGYGYGDRHLSDIAYIAGASDDDDSKNDLAKVANKYPQVLMAAKPGDVVFFNGHVLHRSKRNFSLDRMRRSFVGHYCNARSFTQWGAGASADDPHASPTVDPVTRMTNASHILARGDTHLPFAQPRFGTACAAILSAEERRKQSAFAAAMMADMDSGDMDAKPADPNVKHDDDEEKKRPAKAKDNLYGG